jgi:uncharacterized protein with HEPN domain
MRDDRERLLDMLEAIMRIEKYAAKGKVAFASDELIQNWIASHLQIIGEAASALSQSLRAKHPEVPWKDIIGLRHVLVHHYFAVKLKIVWSVVEDDIPVLKPQIEAMLNELGPGSE